MTADSIKLNLHHYFLYERNFLMVMTEQTLDIGIADILAIDRNFMSREIEIKTGKSDLQQELNSIESCSQNRVEGRIPKNGKCSKLPKHQNYLVRKRFRNRSIPNRLYFAVPTNLVTTAITGLMNTPYGLIEIVEEVGTAYSIWVKIKTIKKAELLHEEPLSQDFLKQCMRRVSGINYQLTNSLRLIKKYKKEGGTK